MESFGHSGVISSSLLLVSALTAIFYTLLWKQRREEILKWSTAAWYALMAKYGLPLAVIWFWPTNHGSSVEEGSSRFFLAIGVVLLWVAVRKHLGRELRWSWAAGLCASFTLWIAAHFMSWISIPVYAGIAVLQFEIARLLWHEGRKRDSYAEPVLSVAFVVWALAILGSAFQIPIGGAFSPEMRLIIMIPQLFVALLLVMAVFEDEKRQIERNMLVLSNLSLAAAQVAGGETSKLLAQSLDRVLGVVRLQTGAILARPAGSGRPLSLATAGLDEPASRQLQGPEFAPAITKLVAQLGGLVTFPQVSDADAWSALAGEPSLAAFRTMLGSQKIEQAWGITLQAKESVFGLLLLGSPYGKQLSPGELRLLLALAHQIGTAIENSQLLEQTERRTEELKILTETGQALSSTLDSDKLLDKITEEVNRLFKGEDFYVGLLDASNQELRFIVDVEKGQRLARHARPVGNHLSEYIIRNRQAVLIHEDFQAEVRRYGAEPRRETGSFLGVPLVIYERAIGVMAVHSDREGAFDSGHLDLLTVLAGEAAIAIENARLFSEERRKTLHLSLLNNISRHAITTLNPDEMLASVVGDMGQNLSYSFVGIGLLDYATKEVIIHAVGGRNTNSSAARGKRVPLSDGILGQVARSGQIISVREASGETPKLVMEESQSGMALPIVYADHLMGVMFCESVEPAEWTEEETLLLQTLSDFVAGALHNAQSFQRAQEQAITDGLTGMKTHRFFMEALSSEWKRATRAGRPFSLVMMDLDRFKFVNDFFGHLEGDSVLQRVSQILEQNCRRSDVVARYGGDEFVVLMPETTLEQAHVIAAKLRSCLATDALLHEKNITGSFGLAGFPTHGSTPQELIQVADASMYVSKHQGGNAVSLPEGVEAAEVAEGKKWKRDVLEAYLGVALKRLFSTGPEAFKEIQKRLDQFMHGLVRPETVNAPELQEMPAIVIEMLTSLALAIDAKDPYTQGHSRKVSAFAVILAQALNLPAAQVDQVRLAGLLHDIGKVGIPESILNKAGPLDADEWEVMKTHAALGAEMLAALEKFPAAVALQKMVRHHHEHWDGSGYPAHFSRTDIPLGARIIAIADAYDTIISDRTYKKGRNQDEARAELERCAGTQFEPTLVRLFVDTLRMRATSAMPGNESLTPQESPQEATPESR